MINNLIFSLTNYAKAHDMISDEDMCYCVNRLLELLGIDEYTEPEGYTPCQNIDEILAGFCEYAYEKGLIKSTAADYTDLFDTKIMGAVTPFPSAVTKKFNLLYHQSPELATEFYYSFSKATNYIRESRIKKDMKWKTDSKYGRLDITINLSKPEKDPKAIAAAKLLPQSGYPKCLLCTENIGYAGRLNSPARQNHRVIPMTLGDERWYMQYSPYVYYNEHCIAFSSEHTPMKIERGTFVKMLDFVKCLPHYFIGSNADLPIVGGSILSHNHMQGGNFTFAMEKAPIEREISFDGFENVKAGIVNWPMSVIRLTCDSAEPLAELSDKILCAWRAYTDKEAYIFADTDGEPHNTITPIARRRGCAYEIDLVLRCNITTKEHPMGLYHPHSELHNIKKENIGLIEVMGLAVLPARLKNEIALMKQAILDSRDFAHIPEIEKHKSWFEEFKDKYTFTHENTEEILKEQIGKTFEKVLEHAGVYKCTDEGRAAFMRFIESVK